MTPDLRPAPRKRSRLAGAALKLAAFALLTSIYAALLLRTHAVEAGPGLWALAVGVGLAGLAALLGFVAMAVVWRSGATGGVRSIFAVVIAAATLSAPAYLIARSQGAAWLDDVSTDLDDPPRLERAGRDRRRSDLAVPGGTIPADQAARQRSAHPDLGPLRLALPPDDVANLVVGLVEARGWRVLGPTAYPRAGPPRHRIEAVASSAALALDDDVVIRIRPEDDGARVDMRSVSRVAHADFGANAARIKDFLSDLAAAANASP